MPQYVKFLKEMLSNKRRFGDYKTVALMKSVVLFFSTSYPLNRKIQAVFLYLAKLEKIFREENYVI